ncbi:MAG: Fe-S cluster assembly ATPase SufC [Chlamydiia bacterium]|nr:Fe-S cluster assembly ATPase SufC [Chlamydiia bacterium]
MLVIKDLYVRCEETLLIKGLNLTINSGEVHALMGPNGAGKSTLAKVLSGHPDYEVVGGEVLFMGQDLLEMEPEERAHVGLFMSFQYPPEIPGVTIAQFLHHALHAKQKAAGETPLSPEVFEELLLKKMHLLGMDPTFKERFVNDGFSGGEKKRNEILQMALLEPKLAILDETDSGLDIDAMRVVAYGVNQLMSKERGLLVITHYQRLLDHIIPDIVHVFVDGTIALSGDKTLALKLEENGYDWVMKEVAANV